MKRVIAGILILVGTIYFLFVLLGSSVKNFFDEATVGTNFPSDNTSQSDMKDPTQAQSVIVNNSEFSYSYIISEPSRVSLVENKLHEDSLELAQKNNCTQFTNGGFYSTSIVPLGLFIVDDVEKYPVHESETLNGFVWIKMTGETGITRAPPNGRLRLGLQSGPIVFENGLPVQLSIATDSDERRVVVGVTEDNRLVLMTVYNGQSTYLGPRLGDLPDVLAEIFKKEALSITNVLNLDGGTASVFNDTTAFLGEFKTVGSIFCIR
ncbi:MAG: phosphodiester glycosidase family protein [Patescibacteria group bacterium]|jgi:uncharacterized protein YigE (DUF2233 family)